MDLRARIFHEIETSSLYREMPVAHLLADHEKVAAYVDEWLSDPRNVAIHEGDDLALFDYNGTGIYEIHLFFRSRGKEAVAAAKSVTRQMFDRGAGMIVASIPAINRKACVVARMTGYHFLETRETPYGDVRTYFITPETH